MSRWPSSPVPKVASPTKGLVPKRDRPSVKELVEEQSKCDGTYTTANENMSLWVAVGVPALFALCYVFAGNFGFDAGQDLIIFLIGWTIGAAGTIAAQRRRERMQALRDSRSAPDRASSRGLPPKRTKRVHRR